MPVGRPKALDSPEQLQELFEEYREWAKQNPYKQHAFVGKDADEVHIEKERALTWVGFEGFLANKGILVHLGHYEQNKDGAYDEFLPIIRVIKKICSADTIEGALAGVFEKNIAARLEGLADKKEVDKTVKRLDFKDAQ